MSPKVKITIRWNSGKIEIFPGISRDSEVVKYLNNADVFSKTLSFNFPGQFEVVNMKFAESIIIEDFNEP